MTTTKQTVDSITQAEIACEESDPQFSSAGSKTQTKQRILVAEDSPVTQDLLKLVLEQRGHAVDSVGDGERALAVLKERSYDVVLIDFHLPKIDGLEVATRFREEAGEASPRFIAITADIKGLLSHNSNCENFDEVIPKPFDLGDVFKIVEREDRQDQTDIPVADVQLLPVSGRTSAKPGLKTQRHEFLRWPEDLNSDRYSARGVQASLADGRFHAILLNEPATVRDLSVIWTTKALHLLPVVDMTGTLSKQADLDGSKLGVEETGKLDQLIRSFVERRAQLHKDLVYTDDIGEKLIGRMFVSGGTLQALHDGSGKECASYNATLDFRSIEKEVKDLRAEGLIGQEFFDRFHNCDRCGSSRFNVREECTDCGSSHLQEEAYLHHFKCAYQGPESDFHKGDDLICPKCRRELSHFSVDYDKPGSMLMCQSCSHATSEPDIGFLCLDCGTHSSGDTVRTRDVYSYTLLDRGLDFARAGRALLDNKLTGLRLAELPLELIVSMNAELKKYESNRKPFALLNISYGNAREIEHKEGVRLFQRTRELFLENLRSTLRKEDKVVSGQNYDFAFIKGASAEDIQAGLDDLCSETNESVRIDLGVHITVFGPEDFR